MATTEDNTRPETPRPRPASGPSTAPRPNTPLSEDPRARYAAEAAVVEKIWEREQEYVASELGGRFELSYMAAHFDLGITRERHRRIIDPLVPYISGRVLEWGCHAGVDSCIYHMRLGDAVDLYGCDIVDPVLFVPFYEFSGLKYTQVQHPYLLDYPDSFFDVATSTGVLEHVPDDANSLRELYRVLKPGGHLLVSCLPNRYSYTEAFSRWRGAPAHDRLYTVPQAVSMLRETGFEVLSTRHDFLVPTMLNGMPASVKRRYQKAEGLVWRVNDVLERLWPVNRLASNLFFAARKPAR